MNTIAEQRAVSGAVSITHHYRAEAVLSVLSTYYRLMVLVADTASPLAASTEMCAVPWSSGA